MGKRTKHGITNWLREIASVGSRRAAGMLATLERARRPANGAAVAAGSAQRSAMQPDTLDGFINDLVPGLVGLLVPQMHMFRSLARPVDSKSVAGEELKDRLASVRQEAAQRVGEAKEELFAELTEAERRESPSQSPQRRLAEPRGRPDAASASTKLARKEQLADLLLQSGYRGKGLEVASEAANLRTELRGFLTRIVADQEMTKKELQQLTRLVRSLDMKLKRLGTAGT